MAEKVIIVLDLEKGDFDAPFKELIDKSEDAGKKSGKAAKKGFRSKFKGFDTSKLSASLVNVAKNAALAGGAIAAVFTAKSIQLASEQEDAIKRMNTSLATAGDYSKEASADIQAFASELQKSTRFGDEAILNQIALAKSFGATNEQAKDIARTAADLSEAMGIDLESATRNVAKTLGGLAGELGETIPALKSFTQEQLKAGAGLKIIAEQFGGTAQQQVKTFGGAMAQLSNTFGDLLEEFGFMIIKSPAVIKTIGVLNEAFQTAIKYVKEFASSFNFTKDIILPILGVADAIATYIVPGFELMFNIGRTAINGVKALFVGLGSIANTIFLKIAEVYGKITGDTSYADALKENAAVIDQEFSAASDSAASSVDSIFEGSFSEKLSERIAEVENFYIEVEGKAAVAKENIIKNNEDLATKSSEQFITYGTVIEAFSEQFSTGITKTKDDFKNATKSIQSFAKKSADAMKNGIGTAAGGAFAKFGQALVSGENALASFGKAFLGAIGQVLIQQGTAFILEGTAYAFSANPALQALAPGLIGSGAAMATFGGILGAVAGGGGGGAAVGGGGIGANSDIQTSSFSDDTETASPEDAERREKQTNVQLVVQGDIFDSEETGTRMAGILSNAFETQGIVLSEGTTA